MIDVFASEICDCLVFGTFEDFQGGVCDANICGLLWILDFQREDIGLFDVCVPQWPGGTQRHSATVATGDLALWLYDYSERCH